MGECECVRACTCLCMCLLARVHACMRIAYFVSQIRPAKQRTDRTQDLNYDRLRKCARTCSKALCPLWQMSDLEISKVERASATFLKGEGLTQHFELDQSAHLLVSASILLRIAGREGQTHTLSSMDTSAVELVRAFVSEVSKHSCHFRHWVSVSDYLDIVCIEMKSAKCFELPDEKRADNLSTRHGAECASESDAECATESDADIFLYDGRS